MNNNISSLTVSKKTFIVAGILTTVHGLGELRFGIQNLACLWLLHPRLQTQACMEPLATSIIKDHVQKFSNGSNQPLTNLIVISFDQRNHGSREVDKRANETWVTGNKTHAQDMFSIYHGTSIDVSLLITHLPAYLFPDSTYTITTNMVCGISLGGHSAWNCVIHDPRILAAIIVVGCPDYAALMSDRAGKSHLDTWSGRNPPGSGFIGSKDFPNGLIEAVEKYDPVGYFLGSTVDGKITTFYQEPSEEEKKRLMPILKRCLRGKRVLNLAGGADEVVPYHCARPFLRWLEDATKPTGWYGHGEVVLENIVFDGVGHEMTSSMVKEIFRFVAQSLERLPTPIRLSKI